MQKVENRITASLLIVLSLISVFAMLHHPSVSSVEIYEQITEINREAKTNTIVHGVLITLLILINLCLSRYAAQRGMHRNTMLYGLILYWLGSIVMILAALMSGAVGPYLAEQFQQANDTQLEIFKGLFLLTSLMNQAFAYFAVFSWCAAICCWSFDMFKQSKAVKSFGLISLVASITISISLFTGAIVLGVSGMTLVLILISLWQLGVAWLLFSIPVKLTTAD